MRFTALERYIDANRETLEQRLNAQNNVHAQVKEQVIHSATKESVDILQKQVDEMRATGPALITKIAIGIIIGYFLFKLTAGGTQWPIAQPTGSAYSNP